MGEAEAVEEAESLQNLRSSGDSFATSERMGRMKRMGYGW